MGKSRKHTSVTGNTCSASEKQDKIMAHRRMRRLARGRLHKHTVAKLTEEDAEDLPCRLREVSDVWTFDKDGKHRFDPRVDPELMRK